MSRDQLLALAGKFGPERHQLAIVGEAHASARGDNGTFLVHAIDGSTGSGLLGPKAVYSDVLLRLLRNGNPNDGLIEQALFEARVDKAGEKISVETIFHAWLLTLPGVNYVAHTHPLAVTSLLCTSHGRLFATRRLFPEQILCCGDVSVFVPYVDPGFRLAQAIRRETTAFINYRRVPPRLILLENHGLVVLGSTALEVVTGTLMAEKAAGVFLAALGAGKPRFLSRAHVDRIARRCSVHPHRELSSVPQATESLAASSVFI